MDTAFLSFMATRLSIIIPVLNEALVIQRALQVLIQNPAIEVIVVDGGSDDRTVELAQALGVTVLQSSQAGRAYQMNLGAAHATGEILLFLHVDTQLPSGYVDLIQSALLQPNTIAGAFNLAIDSPLRSRRLIEKLVNWRSHTLSLPYGDQAIFLKASVFQAIGGFADLPIMEDFELMRRLQAQGKITIISTPVLTSDRRWQKVGVWTTTLINQLMIVGYYCGVSPQRLAQFYRHHKTG